MKKITTYGTLLLLAVSLFSGGCNKKTEKLDELETEDEGKPAVDPALAEAVAAASASAAPAAGPADMEGGPPDNGVFAPGAADKELKAGDPPKITLGGEGTAPLKQLTPLPPIGDHQLRIRLSMRTGRQQLVPLDLALGLKVSKPQAVDKDAPDPEGAAVEATIKSAAVDAAKLPQQVDQNVEKEVAKLKGSKITFSLDATGTGRDFTVTASDKNRQDTLNALTGILATITIPVPNKPVGKGALWMATTREKVLGIDTLSYRLIKVEGFDGDQAILKIDTKRYAADARQIVPAVSETEAVEFQKFLAEGTGMIQLPVTGGFPAQAKIGRELASLVVSNTDQGQALLLQERVDAVIEASGTDSSTTTAKPRSPVGGGPTPAAAATPPATGQ